MPERDSLVSSSEALRTPEEWLALKHPNLQMRDPDGWRGLSGRAWTDPISEAEFEQRLIRCTISGTWGKDAA
jgi:hypothetical protein